ncbi:MAG: hypothetical protein KA116_02930 [Proteobacteria bacterium]|nr:hypothetical protein [Pseudomonadota bacterium]
MKFNLSLRFILSLIVMLGFSFSPVLMAQASEEKSDDADSGISFDAKDAFGTILVAGLVGGVIGLSTLPFYSHPNKHVKNITLGAGAAMIGSALYMTFDLANNKAPSKEEGAGLFHQNWILAPAWDPSNPKLIGMDFTYLFQ